MLFGFVSIFKVIRPISSSFIFGSVSLSKGPTIEAHSSEVTRHRVYPLGTLRFHHIHTHTLCTCTYTHTYTCASGVQGESGDNPVVRWLRALRRENHVVGCVGCVAGACWRHLTKWRSRDVTWHPPSLPFATKRRCEGLRVPEWPRAREGERCKGEKERLMCKEGAAVLWDSYAVLTGATLLYQLATLLHQPSPFRYLVHFFCLSFSFSLSLSLLGNFSCIKL